MPTQPTPEDLYDIESLIGRPALQCVVVSTKSGPKTLVLRSNDADDSDALIAYLSEHPGVNENAENEFIISRCLVAFLDGDQEPNLDTLPIPEEPIYGPEWVRKLRKAIREAQWQLVATAMLSVSLTLPDVPSSPES